MKYNFSIIELRRQDVGEFEDVVTHIRWRLTGTDSEGYEGTFTGATPLEDLSQLSELTFVPYSELKEKEIISWIEVILDANEHYRQHIEDRIHESINNERLVKVASEKDLPWLNT